MSATLELVLRLNNQASPEVRAVAGDLRGLSVEAQAAGASIQAHEQTQNRLALALLNSEAAAKKLATAQAELNANTDPEQTAALTREVVEAQVALDRETNSVDRLQKELKELDTVNDKAGGSTTSFASKAGAMVTTLAGVAAGAAAVGVTLKKAFDFAEEGAQLQFLEDRYGRLAQSIGADSQEMLNALKEASGGMMSDAKLIETASQIISLGLAKNQDSVVDLAGLVTNLGWDMGTVIMTFANNSKMRLDSLGLSVTDVEARMKKLQAQGHSTDEAFDMAVIEAGQAKLELLGSAADSASGAYKRLEADAENLKNRFKVWLAEGLQPVVSGLAGTIDALEEGHAPITKTLTVLNELNKTFGGVGGDGLVQRIKYWETGTINAASATGIFANSNDALAQAMQAVTEEVETETQAVSTMSAEYERQAEQADRRAQQQIVAANAQAVRTQAEMEQAAALSEVYRAAYQDIGAAVDSARGPVEALVLAQADLQSAQAGVRGEFETSAEAAEDASGRIAEANAAISSSYKQVAFDIVNAKLAEKYGENATAAQIAAIQTQQALGLISQAEAEHLTEIAVKSGNIQQTVTEMTDQFLADGVLTEEEMGKIANATALIEGASVSTAKGMAGLGDAFGEASDGAKELKDNADEFTGGSPYAATIEAETDTAKARLDAVKALMDSLDGRVARTTVEVNDQTGGGKTGGGGKSSGDKGAGGGGDGPASKGEPEFLAGGYTGSGSSGEFAGRVHYNEFVLNSRATAQIGRQNLEAMNQGGGLPSPNSSAQWSIYIDARGSFDPRAVEEAGYQGAKRALAEAGINASNIRKMK